MLCIMAKWPPASYWPVVFIHSVLLLDDPRFHYFTISQTGWQKYQSQVYLLKSASGCSSVFSVMTLILSLIIWVNTMCFPGKNLCSIFLNNKPFFSCVCPLIIPVCCNVSSWWTNNNNIVWFLWKSCPRRKSTFSDVEVDQHTIWMQKYNTCWKSTVTVRVNLCSTGYWFYCWSDKK